MSLTRRAAMPTLAGFLAAPAIAQDRWKPTGPIRVIIPFGAGGTMDPVVRVAQSTLEADLGQPVVIDYRPGAATVVGGGEVLRAPSDGTTVFMMANSFAANPTLRPKAAGTWLTAFSPVALASVVPHVLVVHPSVASDMPGFLEAARRPGAGLSWGSQGIGTSNHLGGEQLKQLAGLNVTHVPYNATSQVRLDVQAGRLQYMLANLPEVIQPINVGSVRAIAISAEHRARELPDTPTMAEAGFPLVLSDSWYGWVVRADTPERIRGRLEGAFLAALKRPAIRQTLEDTGYTVLAQDGAALRTLIRKYYEAYAHVIQRAGIKVE